MCECQNIDLTMRDKIETITFPDGVRFKGGPSFAGPVLLIDTTWDAAVACDDSPGRLCEGSVKIEPRSGDLWLKDKSGKRFKGAFTQSMEGSELKPIAKNGRFNTSFPCKGLCGGRGDHAFGILTLIIFPEKALLRGIRGEEQTLFTLKITCGNSTKLRPFDVSFHKEGIRFPD